MTIDEAIAHARDVAEEQRERCEQCAKDHEQLAEWLEELKDLRQGKADAIDECFAIMKKHSNPLWHDWLDKIAEQMKK